MEYIINDFIKIIDSDVCTFHEVGNWYTHLKQNSITYVSEKHQSISYNCDCKLIIANNTIIGYFFAIDKYILDNSYPFDKYDKVYEIFDMSIDYENQSLDIFLKTFDYIIDLAKNKGCKKIIIRINHDDFKTFYDICLDKINMSINNNYLYYKIDEYKILENEKYIIPQDEDKLDLLEVAYLLRQGFNVNQTKCERIINNIKISINRKSGCISFLNYHFDFNKNKFYNLIYFIIETINNDNINKVCFNKLVNNYLIDAILDDNAIFFNMNFYELLSKKHDFIYILKDENINIVKCYNVTFDELFGLGVSNSYLEVDKILNKYKKMEKYYEK